ncbi:MAG: 4Fe-4S dicluster domain-containing protein [Deltaproteobacteria bacterium]|nr:MAG: 4Fe-4S dicluster domain-containing protein [Deltaproteobacteria bacterium]
MREMRYIDGVSTLSYEESRCVGCGLCAVVCPRGVFAFDGGKARVVDRDLCMECGACARNCEAGAIFVVPGVGCAYAVLLSTVRGKGTACGPSCGPGSGCCD